MLSRSIWSTWARFDIVARIRDQDQRPNVAHGDWIIGQGWDEGAFADAGDPGGYPMTDVINEAFPDNPLALESLHGFGAMANAAALARTGIADETPDPESGTISRGANGQATGVMLTLAQALLFDIVPIRVFGMLNGNDAALMSA